MPKKSKSDETLSPEEKKRRHDEKWRKALRQAYIQQGMTGPEADRAATGAMDREQLNRALGVTDSKF